MKEKKVAHLRYNVFCSLLALELDTLEIFHYIMTTNYNPIQIYIAARNVTEQNGKSHSNSRVLR